FAEPPVQGIAIRLEYLVAAARWAPSYVARLDGERVAFEIRAVAAQDTGEDWANVPLSLSTAEPARFAALPELHALRIGRRQQEPAKAGYRAAPTGADALYADYDRELPARRHDEPKPVTRASPPVTTPVLPADGGGFSDQVWDEGESRSKEAYRGRAAGARSGAPPAPSAAPMLQAMPQQARASTVVGKKLEQAKGAMRRLARSSDEEPDANLARGGGAMYEPEPDVQAPAAGPAVPRLDYGHLRMAGPSSGQRGRLIAAPPDRDAGAFEGELAAAKARIAVLPLPPGCRAEWAHAYDYAYVTDGAVDVRSDGAWHAIAVTAKAASAKVRHVAVPREQADVFRVAAIANPFAGPLLPGPIDVYDRGRFLITSELDYTPPSATVEIGLGVDATVKIARNCEFREEATGMLRGKLELHHQVTIDVENLSGRGIELEVRERVPVTADGDDDVDVVIGRIEPGWERWTPDPGAPKGDRLRGGHRWRLALLHAQKKTLRAAYVVTIAGKHELVGGNRREP
ncbi:MAG: DUF4139 domain-containing protein, partial [Deltaproteobacteria bacterium]|nr:DUF4139 domain-containing protein [Deltaproteobacteria bacterium]